MKSLSAAFLLFLLAASSDAPPTHQSPLPTPNSRPWFGVTLPPKAGAAPAVRVGTRPPRPTTPDTAAPEFAGAAIKSDVDTIVGFARAAGMSKEIGNGQMWGRISGFPSSDKTVEWAIDQFRRAGITDVKTQAITQDEKSSLWLPLSWRVTLIGDPAFGAGSTDVVLESALPVGPGARAR